MEYDPILTEVHAIKEKIAREANYDMQELARQFHSLQEQYKDRLVRTLPPRPPDESFAR